MQKIVLCQIASSRALRSLLISFFLAVHLCLTSVAFADDQVSAETTAIDSREQELRRKEEELLRAIDLSSTNTPQSSISPSQAPRKPVDLVDRAGGVIMEVKAPQEPIAAESLGQIQPSEPRIERATALEELARHPALEPIEKVPSSPPIAPNRVRTMSYDDFPDGTTAQRVGSFYRIKRGGDTTDSMGAGPPARTVPIQDMSPTHTARPALLTSDELATIRNSSTYLRTGPTRLDSALLKVPQYTEVTIDYRSGTWYRVRTENGVRGWVPGSSLLFDAHIPPHSTVRVSGVR